MRKTFLAALALAAACSGGEKKDASTNADLDRDLALAQSQAQPQPQLQDTAVAPTPEPTPPPRREVLTREPVARPSATPSPRPRPRPQPVVQAPQPAPAPAPAPSTVPDVKQPGTIAAGTSLALSMGDRVCTRSSRPGDKLVATTTEAIHGQNGAEIPAGSKVVLEVLSSSEGSSPESGQITFRIRSIELPDGSIDANGEGTLSGGLERTRIASGSSDRKKVATGAIAGAILGQIMGRSTKATVIGAATGAAAGAAAAKMGEQWEGCAMPGSTIRMTLDRTIVMRTT